ncbi:MAG: guanylate kinase [Calditrichaeota bacterium]|nr:MAG: guanylate kinase [Calditrichota bacterium]
MGRRGLLVVISAPSGGGKTTVIQRVMESMDGRFQYSVSATTRPRRGNEKDGRDYYFLSLDEFEQKKKRGEFAEWAEVHGHFYGTPKAPLETWLEQGKVVLLDLDVDGGLQIKEHYGHEALLIFIKPPSVESLRTRLRERNTETEAQITKRLERYPKELKKSEHYDYQIVNRDVEETVATIKKLIEMHLN